MPETDKVAETKKLKAKEVDKLKGKLVELRRVGAKPIYIPVSKTNSILQMLENGDVPTDDEEIKIEGQKEGAKKWEVLAGSEKAVKYSRVVVTTKVRGSC